MEDSRERLFANMARHGAKRVDVDELFREGQVIWQLRRDEEISETCIQLEEFMASAARNAGRALRVIDRMANSGPIEDGDLLTALKKYVEDTCEAIKVVDNKLRGKGASLESLLSDRPKAGSSSVSWRGLIARRDVIAHKLLTVDDQRVYGEAAQDFGVLHQLLSNVYFVPVKTDWASNRGFAPRIQPDALRRLDPLKPDTLPSIGQCLIFICEDERDGFLAFRLGRSQDNTITLAASQTSHGIRIEISQKGVPPLTNPTGGDRLL